MKRGEMESVGPPVETLRRELPRLQPFSSFFSFFFPRNFFFFFFSFLPVDGSCRRRTNRSTPGGGWGGGQFLFVGFQLGFTGFFYRVLDDLVLKVAFYRVGATATSTRVTSTAVFLAIFHFDLIESAGWLQRNRLGLVKKPSKKPGKNRRKMSEWEVAVCIFFFWLKNRVIISQ